jgi:ComF family protein
VSPGAASASIRVREGVFSSTGFRIRAAQPTAAVTPVLCWAKRAAASLFFTFFPADCRICGSPLLGISRLPVCDRCLGSLRPLSGSFCALCGEDLPIAVAENLPGDRSAGLPADVRCRLCQLSPPPFERAVASGSYDGALRDLIHLLKFDQVRPAAQVLGRMLADSITGLEAALPSGTIAVVPVPLHAHKQSQRGFNQAELIVRAAFKKLPRLGREGRFELCPHTLVRLRDTGSQIGLNRHRRRQNLRGAFAVKDAASIAKRDVLLVDDVYTTGATASECARVLRRAGAARVWVATVGRTLRTAKVFAIADDFSVEQKEQVSRERRSGQGRDQDQPRDRLIAAQG